MDCCARGRRVRTTGARQSAEKQGTANEKLAGAKALHFYCDVFGPAEAGPCYRAKEWQTRVGAKPSYKAKARQAWAVQGGATKGRRGRCWLVQDRRRWCAGRACAWQGLKPIVFFAPVSARLKPGPVTERRSGRRGLVQNRVTKRRRGKRGRCRVELQSEGVADAVGAGRNDRVRWGWRGSSGMSGEGGDDGGSDGRDVERGRAADD
jgi:hypothetical protein